MTSEKQAQKLHTDDAPYPDLGSASGWLVFGMNNQKHYPELGSDASSGMEFLRLFLRHHLVGKPVVASPNVGCFLMLS